jgi:acetyl-CoA synthetase
MAGQSTPEKESDNLQFGGEIVWRPTDEYVSTSRLKQFMARQDISTVAELHARSIEDPDWFWKAVLDEIGIQFYQPYRDILDLSRGLPWARWCTGGKMNIVHNCIEKWIGTPVESRLAILWEAEEGARRSITYGELNREVNALAGGLRALGLKKGDAVGIFMPMVPEIAVALFAIAKLGGIILPLFSGYGSAAVASRLIDAAAKFLITADGFYRRGEIVPLKQVADEALRQTPSVERVVVLRRTRHGAPWQPDRDLWWDEVARSDGSELPTEQTEAEDPLMVIYTSGTTGKPKGILHTHCGFPIKAAQDMLHGLDVHDTDRVYWVTDMGWMMGPWEVFGVALLGATMVFYDGALDYPDPGRLWQLAQNHQVTILGVSPTLVRSLMRYGDEPVRRADLSKLRILASTGEPWNVDPWLWFFNTVGRGRLPIINYSGGTEISGGILMGNVLSPLKPCAFSGPLPGMAADVVDDDGHSVRNQVGELVIRGPWIGMARGFWQDPERYLETYWNRFPGLWVHGDWAAVDEDGFWYILGRSDDTIKVAGKRVGPAEIESVLVGHPAISEAAAIALPDPLKGEAVVCFCVTKPGRIGDSQLAEELKNKVARDLGKPLRPAEIRFVSELPKTRNAKVMRRVIRAISLGKDPGDVSALENPAAVDEIRKAI